jgi:nucleoside-diphosphate-sugar epimerase
VELEGKKIFLTGGSGFIGTHICERLIGANELVVYDNGTRDAIQYTALRNHPRLTFVQGDILDKAHLQRSAQGAHIIIHLAAVAGVSNYYDRPVETMRTNLLGTSNILDVARELSPELFVNFSSSEVYGPETSGAHESDTTTQGEVKVSRWTYAVSKLAGEHLSLAFHREYGLPVVSVRPFNVYGPRQIGEGAVQIFAPLALRNEPITVHNDGSAIRAWCYIDDFVDGLVRCLTRREAIGETFNLGNPIETVSVRTLAEKIVKLCDSRSEIRFAPYRPEGEVTVRIPSIKKAEAALGFRPRVALDEGLAKTIAWYRDVYSRR